MGVCKEGHEQGAPSRRNQDINYPHVVVSVRVSPVTKIQLYSHLCLNPYLSVDTKKYGLLQSMGFGRACPRPLFLVVQVLYYVLDDYVRLNATN